MKCSQHCNLQKLRYHELLKTKATEKTYINRLLLSYVKRTKKDKRDFTEII